MRYVILGTAGHIDHGKSTLVHALTGIDPDRLKEEKERGITIDLGFAYLNYPDGLRVGIIDVPGHEKLIKNMLAGAGGIDIVLLVIAADEGIMPQSKEHLAICNLLKIKKGLIALTKSDLVEKDWLSLITDDIRNFVKGTFLEGAEIIPVSSKTGYNLELLKEKIKEIALSVEPKPVKGIFRLPVDRVFTLKGFGTVVTGTAISGSISVDAPVEILSKGIKTKVRGLHSHGESLKTACAGQRVAINLQGVGKEEIQRGDVMATPDKIKPTSMIDARIELLEDISLPKLQNRSLIHFYTGTSELVGRIILYDKEELKPGESLYCQFRFQNPVPLMTGDRYIIRRFSPLLTIGGGEILDTLPRRRKRKEGFEDLKVFELGSLEEKLSMKILHYGVNGVDITLLEGWIKAELSDINNAIKSLITKNKLIQLDNRLIHKEAFDIFSQKSLSIIKDFHKNNPLKPGMLKEDLRAVFKQLDQRLFESLLAAIKDIEIEKEILRLKTFKIFLSDDKKLLKEKILKTFDSSSFQPPTKEELSSRLFGIINIKELDALLKIMASEGALVRINDSLYLSLNNYTKMMDGLRSFFKTKKEMTVGEFRNILNTTRKYALPFLEYLDSHKITLRVRDVRIFLDI
ncbi:MAG: selenocysteine-specific translation elongation factor [Thermodesulfovibrionia bacterium]|nr:selenocysteine-specific translation elongation factor [Thermodesulfovibrionia bacterium]